MAVIKKPQDHKKPQPPVDKDGFATIEVEELTFKVNVNEALDWYTVNEMNQAGKNSDFQDLEPIADKIFVDGFKGILEKVKEKTGRNDFYTILKIINEPAEVFAPND